eukprot:Colp12_sorted_trinity150504_noHs@969
MEKLTDKDRAKAKGEIKFSELLARLRLGKSKKDVETMEALEAWVSVDPETDTGVELVVFDKDGQPCMKPNIVLAMCDDRIGVRRKLFRTAEQPAHQSYGKLVEERKVLREGKAVGSGTLLYNMAKVAQYLWPWGSGRNMHQQALLTLVHEKFGGADPDGFDSSNIEDERTELLQKLEEEAKKKVEEKAQEKVSRRYQAPIRLKTPIKMASQTSRGYEMQRHGQTEDDKPWLIAMMRSNCSDGDSCPHKKAMMGLFENYGVKRCANTHEVISNVLDIEKQRNRRMEEEDEEEGKEQWARKRQRLNQESRFDTYYSRGMSEIDSSEEGGFVSNPIQKDLDY